MLISCQTIKLPGEPVEVKDQLWYADKGPLGALRVHTLSNLQLEIAKEKWDSLDANEPNARFGMMCAKPEVFAEGQRIVQLLCSYYGYCTYDLVVEAMNNMERLKRTGQRARQQVLDFQTVQ